MPRDDPSLWGLIAGSGLRRERWLYGAHDEIELGQLAAGSSLDCRRDELDGSSVLLAADDQLTAGLALIELDGVARRIVLCPPDAAEHISHLVETAEIDAIVVDDVTAAAIPDGVGVVRCRPEIRPAETATPAATHATEWVLLTSGTTGVPKMVVHTLTSLTGAIKPNAAAAPPTWSTFYDIRRYGGLQIFLRAALGGGSLILSSAHEPVADFIARAGRHGVTHISGTPSHWRRALMSPAAGRMTPGYVRMSGEIADQPIIDDLKAFYAPASVGHAFATTEAGVAFEVNDGLAGFPAELIGWPGAEVEMTVADGSLRIRSARTASHYLGPGGELRGPDGFVDTGDMLERQGERYLFVGRRGGIVNVGGLKVHPEEVEAALNRHPAVQMSLVKARKNPFTGAVVVADVVVRPERQAAAEDAASLQRDIIAACRRELAAHKVPAAIRFVAALDVGAAGKIARRGG